MGILEISMLIFIATVAIVTGVGFYIQNKKKRRNNLMAITRFAPSPTGYLHIGGLRTSLYSYLWARKQVVNLN